MTQVRWRTGLWTAAVLVAGLGNGLATAPSRAEDSPAFKASIRHTIEVRNRRRRERANRPPGKMDGWPMPPALVIRQTPEAHDEIRDFLRLLRGY